MTRLPVGEDPRYTGQPLPECTVCHMRKPPRGRDPGMLAASSYCQHECPGHYLEPRAGALWPGELREDFGYPASLVVEAQAWREIERKVEDEQ